MITIGTAMVVYAGQFYKEAKVPAGPMWLTAVAADVVVAALGGMS